jgi:hypothetical protein
MFLFSDSDPENNIIGQHIAFVFVLGCSLFGMIWGLINVYLVHTFILPFTRSEALIWTIILNLAVNQLRVTLNHLSNLKLKMAKLF